MNFLHNLRTISVLVMLLNGGLFNNISYGQPDYPPKDILIILLDDVGYDAVNISGLPGNELNVHTPELDNLAKQGILFTNAIATPWCSPSRSCLFTGRYPSRTGVTAVVNHAIELRGCEKTIAEVARDVGYQTSLIGKWHLGQGEGRTPIDQGFDDFFGYLKGCMWSYTQPHLQYNDGKVIEYNVSWLATFLVDKMVELHNSKAGAPRFSFLALGSAHTQMPDLGDWQMPPDDLLYTDPESAEYFYDNTNPVDMFRATVKAADTEIGRFLRELGILDIYGNYDPSCETIVIIASDNGTPAKAHPPGTPLHGRVKRTLYEYGIRVPFIVLAPDVIPQISDRAVDFTDIFTTLTDVMGVQLEDPRSVDGHSFADLLGYQASTPVRTLTYAEKQPNGYGTVHSGRYKLFSPISQALLGTDGKGLGRSWEKGKTQEEQPQALFDLVENPDEDSWLGGLKYLNALNGYLPITSKLRVMQRFLSSCNPTYIEPLHNGKDALFHAFDTTINVYDAVVVSSNDKVTNVGSLDVGFDSNGNESRILFRADLKELQDLLGKYNKPVTDLAFGRFELTFEDDVYDISGYSQATGVIRIVPILQSWDRNTVTWDQINTKGFAQINLETGRLMPPPTASQELSGWHSGSMINCGDYTELTNVLITNMNSPNAYYGFMMYAQQLPIKGDQRILFRPALAGSRIRVTRSTENVDPHLNFK